MIDTLYIITAVVKAIIETIASWHVKMLPCETSMCLHRSTLSTHKYLAS